ncbi:ADYC domain-containing protein [Pyxidicoccus caerfyrddinensis]|uniref:ADYC domain-containing protein n=1 Tax=Pyxidicoccus caerfyrddinensis TaxID=2709663 RepID=UPI0013D90493|nr:ADYC domain-containing protein [Pyxidicoccus caerfyrddinensis]
MKQVKNIRPSWLGLMAVLLWVSGCKTCGSHLPPPQPVPDKEAPADAGTVTPPADKPLSTTGCGDGKCKVPWPPPEVPTSFAACPTGSCGPGSQNGRGIYVSNTEVRSYCFRDEHAASPSFPYSFCPELFFNTPTGVRLQVRDWTNPNYIRDTAVQAWLEPASGARQPVTLKSIRSDQSRLVITYETAGQVHEVTGAGLEQVRLSFQLSVIDDVYMYEMKLNAVPGNGGPEEIQRYRLSYRYKLSSTLSDWIPHCEDAAAGNRISFLGGKKVDGLTARVTDEPGVTTLSCETGAISTCLAWGYTPWSSRTGDPKWSDYLFRSCLHAKRAAYFVQFGDFNSYTVSGTEIFKRDPFGINSEQMDHLEALWSPRGAECLNRGNARHRELLPDSGTLPSCPETRWEQNGFGRLATSPQSLP